MYIFKSTYSVYKTTVATQSTIVCTCIYSISSNLQIQYTKSTVTTYTINNCMYMYLQPVGIDVHVSVDTIQHIHAPMYKNIMYIHVCISSNLQIQYTKSTVATYTIDNCMYIQPVGIDVKCTCNRCSMVYRILTCTYVCIYMYMYPTYAL